MFFKALFTNRIARAIGAVSLAAGVFTVQPYRPVKFVGNSMEPTYKDQELALASTNTSHLKRGDVVVIDSPMGTIVKRIAYLPGDPIERFYFQGQWHEVVDDIKAGPKTRERMKFQRTFIPEGYVYVLGDNPTVSIDSRQFGMLPVSSIRYVLTDSKPMKVSVF